MWSKIHLYIFRKPHKMTVKKTLILHICNTLQKPLSSPSTHELCFVKQLCIKGKDVNFILKKNHTSGVKVLQ